MDRTSKRATAIAFFVIAAGLEMTRYFVAAIWGAGHASWSRDLFANLLQYVGPELRTLALVAVAVGAVYLVWAEFTPARAKARANFDALNALRGIRTLAPRMDWISRSAREVAGWLAARPEIASVRYPGVTDGEDHALVGRMLPR